jgi:hypothetical protein
LSTPDHLNPYTFLKLPEHFLMLLDKFPHEYHKTLPIQEHWQQDNYLLQTIE